ncbi:c-type cytochrome, partial [Oxalobacteraceae bacterium OM1]
VPVADEGAQVARGAYLARAGNCMACHTTRGGEPYAGGRAIATPFGAVYSTNLTPDRTAGIGSWSADDFWRALHNGKSKDGSFLYPAFPYTDYTKVTREDADALFAFLQQLPPSVRSDKTPELRFPYNQRILLAAWRALYFRPGVFEADATQSAQWNRGAYLVQGLGHCAACHDGRDALGGKRADRPFDGGLIPELNWYAPSLAGEGGTGVQAWTDQSLSAFLQTGMSARGAALGPMADVVAGSLQHLSGDDAQAMVAYLKTVPARSHVGVQDIAALPADTTVLKRGAALYEDHCASCHGADGLGVPNAYPPLAGSRVLAAQSPVNAIRVALGGGFAPATSGNPRPYGMPPFGAVLNDADVAAVLSYVRMNFGNHAGMVSVIDVGRYRGPPAE